ncbi:MAG: hypothetical protein AABX28_00970 [Nanoarchaeota archaeon]
MTEIGTIFDYLVASPVALVVFIISILFFNKVVKLSVWLTILASLALAILSGVVIKLLV